MTPNELNNLRVLVVGAGVTGQSVMRYLSGHAIAFDVTDSKSDMPEGIHQWLAQGKYLAGLESVDTAAYDVMVLSPGIPRAHPMIVSAIENDVHVIGDVELFASVVSGDVIAITGSNGKSTVASMAEHVLRCAGREVELCGNIGTAVLDVLPTVAAECSKPSPVYVLELSSYQLESVHRLAPLAATVLNISDDHLDRYESIEHYAATKRCVYEQAKVCVANFDDARTAPSNTQSDCWWFSLNENADAKFHVQRIDGELNLCVDNQPVLAASELSVPGQHNIANALAVMALLHPLKLSAAELKNGLSSFHGLEHRTELVAERHGVRWFNDSKGTNVDACMKAVEAMPGPVVLIAGGQGKGVDFSPLRAVVAERVKTLVLLGEDAPLLRAALHGAAELIDVNSMPEAVEVANQVAASGDVVLLSPACASFDMFENYMARGREFRESVEQLAA